MARREEARRRVAHTQAQIDRVLATDLTRVEMRDLLVFLCGNDSSAVERGLDVIVERRMYERDAGHGPAS